MNAPAVTSDVMNRARGVVLGQAIGDALGTTVEFQRSTSIQREYPNGLRELIGEGPFHLLPGQITDDTELALSLARSIVEAKGFNDDVAAQAYCRWYHSGPFDIGGTIRSAFGTPNDRGAGLADRVRACAAALSQANGSLMRQSPLGVFGWNMPAAALADLACRDSTLSHPHVVCQESCVAFTHAIAFAIRTGSGAHDVYDDTLCFMRARPAAGASTIVEVLIKAQAAPPTDFSHQMGWVLIALQNAFYRLIHSPSVEHALVETVQCGGDTDTNACIAGALTGATWGESGIPPRWIETLLNCRTTRPECYQCGDLLQLAESLVHLGLVSASP